MMGLEDLEDQEMKCIRGKVREGDHVRVIRLLFLWEVGKDNHKIKEMYLIMLKLFVRCVNNCGNLEDIRFTQLLKG